MERSEMVKKIRTHLANQFDLVDDPKGYFDLEYEASLILTIIESHGMLPPKIYNTERDWIENVWEDE